MLISWLGSQEFSQFVNNLDGSYAMGAMPKNSRRRSNDSCDFGGVGGDGIAVLSGGNPGNPAIVAEYASFTNVSERKASAA